MKKHTRMLPAFGMSMAEEGTRDRRRFVPAGLLTLAIGVAMCCVLATGTALAGGGVAADHPGKVASAPPRPGPVQSLRL